MSIGKLDKLDIFPYDLTYRYTGIIVFASIGPFIDKELKFGISSKDAIDG